MKTYASTYASLYSSIMWSALRQNAFIWVVTAAGVFFTYYGFLLLITIIRFGEIPNYVEVYDIIGIYINIFKGTPSLSDAIPIMLDEAWIETGYKNPEYYGIATWSYMLIPPRMLLVVVLGVLVASMVVLLLYSRKIACPIDNKRKLYTLAGVGTGLISLTSATLTWVVCCATPSWVVALAMLGMSSSLALMIEPFGKVMSIVGVALLLWIIVMQLRRIAVTRQAALV